MSEISTSDYFHLSEREHNLIKKLQQHYVFVPTDKSPQTITAICKKHYLQRVIEAQRKNTEISVDEKDEMKSRIATAKQSIFGSNADDNDNEPYLYLSPKMHKPANQDKYRDIVGSTTEGNYMTQLGNALSKILRVCMYALRAEDQMHFKQHGFHIFIAEDNLDIAMSDFRSYGNIKQQQQTARQWDSPTHFVSTDFATMFVSAHKDQVIQNVAQAVANAFNFTQTKMRSVKHGEKLVIKLTTDEGPLPWKLVGDDSLDESDFDVKKIETVIRLVVQNTFFKSGNKYYAQNGLAIGGDASSELANLMLANVERMHIMQCHAANYNMQAFSPAWNVMKRYVDDMLSVNTLQQLIPTKEAYGLEYSSEEQSSQVIWCGAQLALTADGLEFNVWDKQNVIPFSMARYTHFQSMVRQEIFVSIICGAVTRVKRFCTNHREAIIHIAGLITKLRERKYPEDFLKKHLHARMRLEFGEILAIPDEAFLQHGRHISDTNPSAPIDNQSRRLIRSNPSNFCFANVMLNMLHMINQ